jgi:hypothetical protein
MLTDKYYTFKDIVAIFRQLAQEHEAVADFGVGVEENAALDQSRNYPAVFLEYPTLVETLEGIDIYNIGLRVYVQQNLPPDVVQDASPSEPAEAAIAQAQMIGAEIIKKLEAEHSDDISISRSGTRRQYSAILVQAEGTAQDAVGMRFEFRVQAVNYYNVCALPFADFEPYQPTGGDQPAPAPTGCGCEAEIAALQEQIDEVVTDTQNNELSIAANEQEIDNLQADVANTQASIVTLQSDVDTVEQDVSDLQSDVQTIQNTYLCEGFAQIGFAAGQELNLPGAGNYLELEKDPAVTEVWQRLDDLGITVQNTDEFVLEANATYRIDIAIAGNNSNENAIQIIAILERTDGVQFLNQLIITSALDAGPSADAYGYAGAILRTGVSDETFRVRHQQGGNSGSLTLDNARSFISIQKYTN